MICVSRKGWGMDVKMCFSKLDFEILKCFFFQEWRYIF